MHEQQGKPNFLVYLAYLAVFAVAINTVYLILPNDNLKVILLGLLVTAVMSGYLLSSRHYVMIGFALDIAGLAVFIYYSHHIYQDRMAFGTYLGEMLAVMMVLRCFKLYRIGDFLSPLVISLTLMVFSAIPSFSAEYVYSLLGFLLTLGLALFLGSVDEFARLPSRTTARSRWAYTYDFLEEYAPVPVSQKRPKELARYLFPALKASIPAVLLAFIVSSAFYFMVDHSQAPGADSPILAAFGTSDLEEGQTSEERLLTGGIGSAGAQYYTGFDTEFDIARGRLLENSTSTDTVMEVQSNLPSYWRGKCFDTYTGRGWVQGPDIASATWSLDPPVGRYTSYHGTVDSELTSRGINLDPGFDNEALPFDEITQTYYLESDLPGIVFTAYQARDLFMPVPGVLIDDTFTIFPPPSSDSMVAGQNYKVVSRKMFAQGDYLNAYDYKLEDLKSEDPEFYERYTALPERVGNLGGERSADGEVPGFDFTRVRAKAYEVTAGQDTVYRKVMALKNYLISDFRFSLNPPSAVPAEKDAVDYFLFDWGSRGGHCEYFSTSLAVLCRSIGIPSRVVTGYATGNYNLLKNRYIVQERHAHAWVEIYWPAIGWIEFDPTPYSWYQGIGEKAAGGWLTFHNAIEDLYVYDPQGFFQRKVIPMLGHTMVRVRWFLNQRELDFYETVDPILKRTSEDTEGPLWLLAGAFAVLLTSMSLRRVLTRDRESTEAVRIGGNSLRRVRRMLLRRGVDPVKIATETDCVIQAEKVSGAWARNVAKVADRYQSARYSGRKVTWREVRELKHASKAASRVPRNGG